MNQIRQIKSNQIRQIRQRLGKDEEGPILIPISVTDLHGAPDQEAHLKADTYNHSQRWTNIVTIKGEHISSQFEGEHKSSQSKVS